MWVLEIERRPPGLANKRLPTEPSGWPFITLHAFSNHSQFLYHISPSTGSAKGLAQPHLPFSSGSDAWLVAGVVFVFSWKGRITMWDINGGMKAPLPQIPYAHSSFPWPGRFPTSFEEGGLEIRWKENHQHSFNKPSMIESACNPNIRTTEAGGLPWIPDQLGPRSKLLNKNLFQKELNQWIFIDVRDCRGQTR